MRLLALTTGFCLIAAAAQAGVPVTLSPTRRTPTGPSPWATCSTAPARGERARGQGPRPGLSTVLDASAVQMSAARAG